MNEANEQLLLGFAVPDRYTYENFVDPDDGYIVESLKRAITDRSQALLCLVGESDSGKTHLCVAAMNNASEHGLNVAYFNFGDLIRDVSPSAFDAYIEYFLSNDVLILDGIEAISGNREYEVATFGLLNQFRDQNKQILISSSALPERVGLKTPDLVSRLKAGLTLVVQPLSEEQKKQAFLSRAKDRAMVIEDDVLAYIFSRSARSLGALLGVLDQLDRAQLKEKRGLTVPFVKKTLGW